MGNSLILEEDPPKEHEEVEDPLDTPSGDASPVDVKSRVETLRHDVNGMRKALRGDLRFSRIVSAIYITIALFVLLGFSVISCYYLLESGKLIHILLAVIIWALFLYSIYLWAVTIYFILITYDSKKPLESLIKILKEFIIIIIVMFVLSTIYGALLLYQASTDYHVNNVKRYVSHDLAFCSLTWTICVVVLPVLLHMITVLENLSIYIDTYNYLMELSIIVRGDYYFVKGGKSLSERSLSSMEEEVKKIKEQRYTKLSTVCMGYFSTESVTIVCLVWMIVSHFIFISLGIYFAIVRSSTFIRWSLLALVFLFYYIRAISVFKTKIVSHIWTAIYIMMGYVVGILHNLYLLYPQYADFMEYSLSYSSHDLNDPTAKADTIHYDFCPTKMIFEWNICLLSIVIIVYAVHVLYKFTRLYEKKVVPQNEISSV